MPEPPVLEAAPGADEANAAAPAAAGKKRRADALDTVRHVVAASGGQSQHVGAVYFTSFVMQ